MSGADILAFVTQHRAAIELFAAVLGLVNVALVVQRSLWNYPFGIAMVSLYFFVFLVERLYSDALLQVFFLGIQVYGWLNWRAVKADEGTVRVEVMRWPPRLFWAAATAIAILAWGTMMHRMTDAAAPYADATIAGLSVAAQLLQSLRRIESWVMWILVDIIAIDLFWSRGLEVTALLYGLFLVMSVVGLIGWARRLKAQGGGGTARATA